MVRLKQNNICLAYTYFNNGVHPETRKLPVRKAYHTVSEIALLLDCHRASVINGITNNNYSGVISNGRYFLIPDWGYLKFFRDRYYGSRNADFNVISYQGVIKLSFFARLLGCDESLLFYYAGLRTKRNVQTKRELPALNIGTGNKRTIRFPWGTTVKFLEERLPRDYLEKMQDYGMILT